MSLIDTIRRVPRPVKKVIRERKEITAGLFAYLGDKLETINEIVMIGSGTSHTCSMTSHVFVEKASGISTTVILPNLFLEKSVYNPNALYIFTSQSGTSTLTQASQKKVNKMGYLNVAITEEPDSPLAKASGCCILMEVDHEEYGCRTIGYCMSAFTHMITAMEIGLARGTLSETDYALFLKDAEAAADHHGEICDATMQWFDKNKWKLMNKDGYALYGAGALYGAAVEGALKVLEIAQRFLCVGYEMDEGMHGPTMGFTNRVAVIILNVGKNERLANGLASYIKDMVGDAFVIGMNTKDERDLAFEPVGGPFAYLEYTPVVEILAARLASDYGITINPIGYDSESMPESNYFNTHDE